LEVVTDDVDFDKAILALITPQEQERNDLDMHLNADVSDALALLFSLMSLLLVLDQEAFQGTNRIQMMPIFW
jgi:hypothetical protein